MIRTPVCDLLQIDHPIALGGMGSVYAPQLVAAVSGAGGLGAMGCHYLTPEQVHAGTAAIRELTNRPFALNFLLFDIEDDSFASALTLRPSVIAFAWPRPEQDVKPYGMWSAPMPRAARSRSWRAAYRRPCEPRRPGPT